MSNLFSIATVSRNHPLCDISPNMNSPDPSRQSMVRGAMSISILMRLTKSVYKSSVASCRAVTRLLDYTSGEVYIHSVPSGTNGSSNNKANRQGNHCVSSTMPRFALNRPEVLVTTEHITMSEFP